MDVYIFRYFYITISNSGKVHVTVPQHQKAVEVTNTIQVFVHIRGEFSS